MPSLKLEDVWPTETCGAPFLPQSSLTTTGEHWQSMRSHNCQISTVPPGHYRVPVHGAWLCLCSLSLVMQVMCGPVCCPVPQSLLLGHPVFLAVLFLSLLCQRNEAWSCDGVWAFDPVGRLPRCVTPLVCLSFEHLANFWISLCSALPLWLVLQHKQLPNVAPRL